MSRWRRESARRAAWGMDAQSLAWIGTGGGVATAPLPDAPAHAFAARPGPVIDVIVANTAAVHWLQEPPAQARSLDELKLVAAARCAHLFGGSPADWWIAADWTTRRAFPCAALRRKLVRPLQDAVAAHGGALRWHTAWSLWCSVRARSMPEEGWIGLRSARQVLLWHCRTGRVDALTSFAVEPTASAHEVTAQAAIHMQLEAAGGGCAPPGEVHWADTSEAAAQESEARFALALSPLLAGGAA